MGVQVKVSHFSFDEKFGIRESDWDGVLCFVNATFDPLGIEFREIKLMEGKGGKPNWISQPAREANGKYYKYYGPAFVDGELSEDGMTFFDVMAEAATIAYEERFGGKKSKAKSKATSKTAAKKASKSTRSRDEDDEDEDDEEEEEEAPAPRRAARGPVKKQAKDEEFDLF